jgi:hypothetical protein
MLPPLEKIYAEKDSHQRVTDLGSQTLNFTLSARSLFSNEKIVDISNNSGSSFFPKIAGSGSNVYVAWADNSTGKYEIYFKKSSDSGNTFGDTINLSNNTEYPSHPYPIEIAASGNNVYVAGYNGQYAFLRISTDNGSSFGNVISRFECYGEEISAAEKMLYAVGEFWEGGDVELLFQTSIDNGTTFDGGRFISGGGLSYLEDIAASGSNVYIVFIDGYTHDNILLNSSNSGDTFDNVTVLERPTDLNLFSAVPTNVKTSAQIGVSGDEAYIFLVNSSLLNSSFSHNITFTSSPTNAFHFSRPAFLTTINNSKMDPLYALATPPEIALSERYIYFVWDDLTGQGDSEILFQRSIFPPLERTL